MVILSFIFLFLDSVRVDLHETLKKAIRKLLESFRLWSVTKNILAPQQLSHLSSDWLPFANSIEQQEGGASALADQAERLRWPGIMAKSPVLPWYRAKNRKKHCLKWNI